MQQFDPNIPGLIQGEVTTVTIIDPAGEFPPFQVGNHVLDRTDAFKISVKWEVTGPLRPLWLSALGGKWNVQAFAESLGGGPEILLAADNTVDADPAVSNYAVELNVAPNTLDEGNPGSQVSGIYKVVVSVFLDSNLGAPGFDMTGFNEGPIIQVEDPQ
ncbi:hypothetical protein E0H75_20420 [Kribbella capetownensis]|uniref:Uncharacterized protein n=1 Tax=Kribbella capetownensis TaxID=1572659 RepID=A0A4R0JR20_9ACTN|nr:hypothetical protein [Kribbella capetownensis]TCC48930.1 hypothetical protein E0H75_20420 [Kribbella capetownensis]